MYTRKDAFENRVINFPTSCLSTIQPQKVKPFQKFTNYNNFSSKLVFNVRNVKCSNTNFRSL